MEDYGQKFTKLLRYVSFIKDEKVKIQIYTMCDHHYMDTSLNLMSLKPYKQPWRKHSSCMTKVRTNLFCRGHWVARREIWRNKGRMCLHPHPLRIIPRLTIIQY